MNFQLSSVILEKGRRWESLSILKTNVRESIKSVLCIKGFHILPFKPLFYIYKSRGFSKHKICDPKIRRVPETQKYEIRKKKNKFKIEIHLEIPNTLSHKNVNSFYFEILYFIEWVTSYTVDTGESVNLIKKRKYKTTNTSLMYQVSTNESSVSTGSLTCYP